MKKLLFTFALTVFCLFTFAQITVIDSSAFLDKNQIKAEIFTGGLNFYDGSSGIPTFEYPKDSGKFTIFCSALWIGGKNQGNLHLAGERYHGNGRDYYPGPVMNPTLYATEVINWNKVWKINKSEIDFHIAHWNDVGYTVPASISQWPVYANPSLGINYFLAPFKDVDGDTAYIPSNGDYPDIRGDQAIYFIFNDSVYQHTETGGKRLGVEVHAMAYAYDTDSLLTKTVFMNYLVYNRSNRVYDSLYMGLFTDIDIGYAQDDYIGCDTTIATYFGYNGDSIDGSGQPIAYGNNPPVQAITFLNQNLNSFVALNNTGGSQMITDPDVAPEYYSLMSNNFCLDTASFTWGMGHPGPLYAYCSKYMFPGYPNDSSLFCEYGLGNSPYDRRGVGFTGPMTLLPGQYVAFDAAYITVDSGFAKSSGFPNVDNMLATVPLIRDYFDNNFPQDGNDLALGIESDNYNIPSQFNVYPNPTNNKITFTTNLSKTKLRLEILDINGRLIQSYECKSSKKEMDISNYKNGVYILKISTSEQSSFVKFIKL